MSMMRSELDSERKEKSELQTTAAKAEQARSDVTGMKHGGTTLGRTLALGRTQDSALPIWVYSSIAGDNIIIRREVAMWCAR